MKRILIADDHESVLRRVRGMIESHPGWEICGDAVTGRQTIAQAAELKPDLVILDFAMPQTDGLKAAAAIKALLPKVPILMFTLLGLGVITIVLNYMNLLPGDASNGYLLLGLGFITGGFITATYYH